MDSIVPALKRRKITLKKQSWRRVATIMCRTSRTSHSVTSNNTLYTFVNGVTGHVDDNIILETLSSLDILFKLDKTYDGVFSQALKAGELSD